MTQTGRKWPCRRAVSSLQAPHCHVTPPASTGKCTHRRSGRPFSLRRSQRGVGGSCLWGATLCLEGPTGQWRPKTGGALVVCGDLGRCVQAYFCRHPPDSAPRGPSSKESGDAGPRPTGSWPVDTWHTGVHTPVPVPVTNRGSYLTTECIGGFIQKTSKWELPASWGRSEPATRLHFPSGRAALAATAGDEGRGR